MRETINLHSLEAEQPHPYPPQRRRVNIWVAAAVIVFVIVFGTWFVDGATQWRAVFLSNDQVYFGHFWDVPFAGTITLKNVYYLELAQGQQLNTQDASQLKLVKLGNEIHGPTDEMVIPMGQVLFWETLRSDSAIVTTIKNGQTQAGQ